jgi:large subunit ribosomal protein L5
LEKVVVGIGLGEAVSNAKALEGAEKDLPIITGQKPIITRSKKSIANFKLREGMPIGLKVTLRQKKMFDFLDRLINVVLPRGREFQGVPRNAFDGRGNYTLGLKEQTIFPEIEYDKIDKVRGLEITIVTTARTDEEGRLLLELLGMPFSKD